MLVSKSSKTFPSYDSNQELTSYVNQIPFLKPLEISKMIRELGYVGQEGAVSVVSLMAYRHISRLRRIYIDGISSELLPPKSNILLIGPTGVGKTFLIEILFRNILNLPTVIVDMTSYSETGYMGQDAKNILVRLLYAADLNPVACSVGVVCLDEFDKVASGHSSSAIIGSPNSKDVSGIGVQRELLKMMENTSVSIKDQISQNIVSSNGILSTSNIAFIACGAFSGFKELAEITKEGDIGFGKIPKPKSGKKIAVSYTEEDVNVARHFQKYGFLPELIARFKRIIPFQALSKEELKKILTDNIITRYTNEFFFEGIKLMVSDELLNLVVNRAIYRETGARGVESVFARCLEEAAFEAYSQDGVSIVRLLKKNDEIIFEIE